MTTIDRNTRFVDLAERETKARNAHSDTVRRLEQVAKKRSLGTAEQAELDLSRAVLAELARSRADRESSPEVCDPLFVGTRTLLNEDALISPELRSHHNGVLRFDESSETGDAVRSGAPEVDEPEATKSEKRELAPTEPPEAPKVEEPEPKKGGKRAVAPAEPREARESDSSSGSWSDDLPITLTTLTLGLLITDGAQAPPVALVPQRGDDTGSIDPDGDTETVDVSAPGTSGRPVTIYPDTSRLTWSDFTREFFRALGEARSYFPLADKVLAILAQEGDPDGRGGLQPTVRCEEFAQVMRRLREAHVGAREPQLRRRVNEMLDRVQNIGSEDSIADAGIELPELEEIQDQNIMADNVRVMGPMIVSTMFEELKVFQVVDRIVEQFQHGTLPIGPGDAGRMLYRYWREAPNRMSEQERRDFAAITLGVPGGDPSGLVNREFNDLWIRFVSSVSSFVRQNEVDALLRAGTPNPISHQQVRKAARDLASNLSLHGYGMAHYAAREVQEQVKFMIKLLSNPEIRAAYGAKDMWQVVDQVATYDLGGAKTSSRYRTLATCGMIITAWLANRVNRINRPTGPLLDIDEVRNPPLDSAHKATVNPNDYDLVNACELWLADTATPDSEIERLSSSPRNTPTMTSKPIPIPAMAREMLDDLGDLGLGLGRGYAPSRSAQHAGNGHVRPY